VLNWDAELERSVVGHRVRLLNPFFEALSYLGTYGAIWLVLAGALAIAWRRPAIASSVFVAVGAADLLAATLKLLIPRARPHVAALVALPHDHSFPSGHAATSFAGATVIGAIAPRARVPLYVLAALVAWSRVYVGVHYPLDVAAGALLGVAVGLAVLRALRWLATIRRRSPRSTRRG
jgi:undecaprenyl-diphosphatase